MRLYARFLIFLVCTRGWVRSFFAFNKALKVSNPGDTITINTKLEVFLPEEGINLKIKMREEGSNYSPSRDYRRRLN